MPDREHMARLDEDGLVILPAKLTPDDVSKTLAVLEGIWEQEGAQAGAENYLESGARRLANLANKGDGFARIYADEQVLELIEYVMGPDIRLAMLNARDIPPHTGTRMPFHSDTDGGRLPDDLGYSAATAIWMLDPFTVENGATAFVPGSHRSGVRTKEGMDDVHAPHPDEIVVTGEPGDVLVFNGHCWHAGRPNRTHGHRRALLVHYLRADVPRGTDRRQHLDPERIAALTARQETLLGLHDRPA